MKKIWWIIPIFLINFIPFFSFSANINSINNIFDAINYIKNTIHFENITIKSYVPYIDVQNAIKKYCPNNAVDQANKELQPLKEARTSYLNNPWIDKSLSDRFDLVKDIISEQKQENVYKYCKDSYLLFSILKTTQDLYSWEKDKKTNNTTNNNTGTKTEDNNSHSSATTKKLDFTFTHDTSGLPNEAQKSFSESSENYLQEILANLVEIHILDQSDLKTLNNKIEVTYQQSCNITEWSFRVVRNKQTWEYTFKWIKLIIAYCEKNNTPERQKSFQILWNLLG